MTTHLVDKEIRYTGEQLRCHWAYTTFGIEGDSIVAFVGASDVRGDALVDLEDARRGETIVARKMLHFIAEHFEVDLQRAILRQRLLVAILAEALSRRGAKGLVRDGDDLYYTSRKLTVSVATVSPLSSLIHLGVNVEAEGAPVPAVGLEELGIDARELAQEVMQSYKAEMLSIENARTKVRPIG